MADDRVRQTQQTERRGSFGADAPGWTTVSSTKTGSSYMLDVPPQTTRADIVAMIQGADD